LRPPQWGQIKPPFPLWPGGVQWTQDEGPHPHEARQLRLDSSRARCRLGWRPVMGLEEGIAATVGWYAALREGADMRAVTLGQIERFGRAAS
jgi:CDP-glucose 4,6-dehydratase